MADYRKLATEARRKVLQMVHKAGTSHIASNFSVLDIATVLYENLTPDDRVVWSKGWAAASIYYFLHKQGKISDAELEQFPNPPFLGLAEVGINGVEVSGGAVGHGLPVAVGLALGKKRASEPGKVYCIMSDGEMNEGATWEAMLVAAHHQLTNLVAIIDYNKWQAMGETNRVLNLEPLANKFNAFNWNSHEVDGHNHSLIESSLQMILPRPLALIAHTIKGKGISFMENHLLYHYKHVGKEDYEKAMQELSV